MAAQTRALKLT